jgi:hypothetical protein
MRLHNVRSGLGLAIATETERRVEDVFDARAAAKSGGDGSLMGLSEKLN